MQYVIDSSYNAAHSLPDEQNSHVDAFFDDLTDEDILSVLQLFWYETSNIFRNNAVRKRIEADDVSVMLEKTEDLNLNTDMASGSDYSIKIFKLARDYCLTCYDAAYLELAMRKQAVLATLDNDLKEACIKAGLQTL
ncbi:MAG: type II toxin-antitoxin system VapC family toxin [Spirochaetaceae bacterium]|jgi:predicted nucleic acid-binding protein|nr:type II toxin-antitoxin system VapC family toxin [Spirochaetaceae bacterium]